jgi:hypothetical protein
MALAAAAVSAVVATGVMAIQAVGDDQAPSRADIEKIATCLRAEGAAVPTDLGDGLEAWLDSHKAQLEGPARRCKSRDEGKGTAPEELLACLRAHGLNPPGNLFRLKPWMLRQSGTQAGKAALSACGVSFDAPTGRPAKAKDCGGGATAPVQKPDGDATPAG